MIRLLLAASLALAAVTLPAADDVVVARFESDSFDGWEVEGTAFGTGPVEAASSPGVTGYRGRRFDAAKAKEIGLVHEVVALDHLDAAVDKYVAESLTAAPTAVARAKALIPKVLGQSPADVVDITAQAIAAQREGRLDVKPLQDYF